MLNRRTLMALAAGTTMLGFSATTATAEDVSFEGETVRIIVPFGEGGGSDTYARTLHVYRDRREHAWRWVDQRGEYFSKR
jgi:tripartite-type tricarboxylate transporter receptor subunit TctC